MTGVFDWGARWSFGWVARGGSALVKVAHKVLLQSTSHITITRAVAQALEYCQHYTGTAIKYSVPTWSTTKLAQRAALYGHCHYIDPTFGWVLVKNWPITLHCITRSFLSLGGNTLKSCCLRNICSFFVLFLPLGDEFNLRTQIIVVISS